MVYVGVLNSFLRLFLLEASLIHPWTCSTAILIDTTAKLTMLSCRMQPVGTFGGCKFCFCPYTNFQCIDEYICFFLPQFPNQNNSNGCTQPLWMTLLSKNNPLPSSKVVKHFQRFNIVKYIKYREVIYGQKFFKCTTR